MGRRITAVIDLGSNSLRMTIAEVLADNTIRELGDYRETVRISENMGPENTIKQVAIQRTIAALHTFQAAMVLHSVQTVIAVATEALRKAENREAFIQAVQAETGIAFQVISGEEEARYVFLGVTALLPFADCLLMDTGGGSCELIHVRNREIQNAVSLPLGGVVLTEGFLESDIVSGPSLFRLFRHIHTVARAVPWLDACRGLPVVAVGGTYKAILSLKQKDTFTPEELYTLYEMFLGQNLEERKKVLVGYEDRGDIIVGGLAPLVYVTNRLQPSRICASVRGIRDGILADCRES